MPQRKAQIIQLIGRGGKQEIALVAVRIGGAMQLWPGGAQLALDIMPRGHAIGVQFLRRCQQILELHPLVAADAGHRGRACQIGIREFLDHRFAEHVFVIQHIMRKAHGFRHAPRIMDITPGAAGALFRQRRAMVIQLQRDADHVIAFFLQHGGHHRTVDAARHGNDHAGVRRGFGQPK